MEFLYRWAGVENVNPISRGDFNGQRLAFLEKFTGSHFFQTAINSRNPNTNAIAFLNSAWDNIYGELLNRILVQGIMKNMLKAKYDFISDSLVFSDSVYDSIALAKNTTINFMDNSSTAYFWLKYAAIVREYKNFIETDEVIKGTINTLIKENME